MRLSQDTISTSSSTRNGAVDSRNSSAVGRRHDAETTQESTLARAGDHSGSAASNDQMTSFVKLVNDQTQRLLHVARRYVDEEQAHDVVQEAFIKAHRHWDTFRGEARVSTWLHRIVVNCCISRLRKPHVWHECSIEALSLNCPNGELHRDQDGISPERHAEIQQLQALCRQCIQKLPVTFRTVVMLRDVEGFTGEETARLLGISVSLVKVRLHRARKSLRDALRPHFR